mmetsp:Transcript_2061/g.4309  ORF Transcript_2061/g.4309 Transcript_2061/m.4309 type:complete len:203 (-) Transcript_2061:288-896(-)
MVRPSPATSGTSFAKARSRLWFSAFTDPNTATRSPTFMPDSSAGDSLAIPLIFAKGRRRGATALPDPFIDEFGRLLLLLFSVATLVDVAWVLSVLLELSRFCDRFSKERLSPPATPETDPSQFITTHFPVTGSYFGRGFGARRRAFSSASSFFFGGFLILARSRSRPSIFPSISLWSVLRTENRLRWVLARYTSISPLGYPS